MYHAETTGARCSLRTKHKIIAGYLNSPLPLPNSPQRSATLREDPICGKDQNCDGDQDRTARDTVGNNLFSQQT